MGYLSKLGVDLGVATGDDLRLEGDSVRQSLLVREPSNLEHEAIGHIFVDHLEMERPRRVQVWHNANVRNRDRRRGGRGWGSGGDVVVVVVVSYALVGGGGGDGRGRDPTS